jgi:mannan endo-1,4-beta-mannosidase
MRVVRCAGITVLACLGLASATSAASSSCVKIGIYADNPKTTLPALRKQVGPRVTVISTYLTAGKALSPSIISTANADGASLLVTWQPDSGRDGSKQPKYKLSTVAKGHYDASLKALVAQLRKVHKGAVLRPMPEMNTPYYAWSGMANSNKPADYVKAWKRVRSAVRKARGGSSIKLLWSPYARSIPNTGPNAIRAYFPGKSQVDLVGSSGYNFCSVHGLLWSEPGAIFSSAYTTIEALAPKPFWLSETGSTAKGGDEAGWIRTLATLHSSSMPKLAGVVWYDVKDPNGDFRIQGKTITTAFKSLLKGACR